MGKHQLTAPKVILVHYAEIGLKGKNQPQFRRRLKENIRLKLKSLGLNWQVQETMGLLAVSVPDQEIEPPLERVLNSLQEVFGIAWLAGAWHLPHRGFRGETSDLADLENYLVSLAEQQFALQKTFAVRVNRGEKSLPFTSPQLEKQLGEVIFSRTGWKKVNLTQPDLTFRVDIRKNVSYLFSEKLRGPGGLPVGIAGRVLGLLSGGIDSPVAMYLMAKRGCKVDFLHFTASSIQPEQAIKDKVWRLARRLSDFTLTSRLCLVPYTYFDLALMREKVPYDLILFRRFMVRVAAQLACCLKADALVTGDNLSQVASQTLSNLASTSRATELPIMRPLLGYDKEEIVALAQRIGTYQDSIEPYKDCCALISRHPKTSSRHEVLTKIEQRVLPDYKKLIEQTLAEAVCLELPG